MTEARDGDAVLRDVMAFITASIAGDDDAVFTLVESLEDPALVLVGLAGLLAEVGPSWATQLGVEDLSELWRNFTVAYTMELEGRPRGGNS